MTLTYLSGERIQGSSTFAASGKIAGTSGTGSVYADWGRNTSNDNLSYDLGATLNDTQWIMRFKLYIDTFTLNHGSGCHITIGMSSHDADTVHGTSQDSIAFGIQFASSSFEQDFIARNSSDAEIAENQAEIGTNMLTSSAGKTYYVEVKRTSATAGTVSVTENSDYTTSTTSANQVNLTSNVSGLRYFFSKAYDGSDVDNHVYGSVSEVKIYDNQSSPTTVTYDVGEFMKSTSGWNINNATDQNIIPILTDEKTTITNVPGGTRFEETDSLTVYRLKKSTFSLTGLKAYFTMGETSGDLINRAAEYGSTDAIANFDLSVTGATQGVTGKYNKCVSFAGNQSAIADDSNESDTAFLSNAGAAWTICFWSKVDDKDSDGNIEGDQAWFSTHSGSGNGVLCRVIATVAQPNNPAYTYMLIGTTGDDKSSGWTTANGLHGIGGTGETGWHFHTIQYNDATNTGRDMKDNSGTWNNVTFESGDGDLTNTDTPSQKFRLAQWADNNNNLDGDIEAFSIWNRILTAAEITSLYTSTEVGQGLADAWVEKGTA